MKWQDKMGLIICKALGDEYDLLLISSNSFSIIREGKPIYSRETAYPIDAHWKEETKQALITLYIEKVNNIINNYDN